MDKEYKDLWTRYIKIFVIVSCYWVISISTVFVNKAVLSGQKVPLEAPLFITWFQCVISFLICANLSATGGIYKVFTFPKGSPWNLNTIKKVGPLSIIFTLMIASTNMSLKHVSLSFYYIARSLTTVFNVILCWLIMRQATSARCMACCAFVIFGFSLGVDQEQLLELPKYIYFLFILTILNYQGHQGSFSLSGTIYGVVSSIILALFSIYTKKTLPHVDQKVWLLTYSINAYSCILFLPLMAINGEIQILWNYAHFGSVYFWIQMSISGICGLAVGHLTSLQIKVTSPLTHNISGTAKACFQTVLATQWHHETKNVLWWLSNGVVLVSSALYAWFRQMEMEENIKMPLEQQVIENQVQKSSRTLEAGDSASVVEIYRKTSTDLGDIYKMEEYSRKHNNKTCSDPAVQTSSVTRTNQKVTEPTENSSGT